MDRPSNSPPPHYTLQITHTAGMKTTIKKERKKNRKKRERIQNTIIQNGFGGRWHLF